MPKYNVVLETTASTCITVEADDAAAALVAAFDEAPGICAQCSGWGKKDVSMDLGEWEIPKDPDGRDADYAVTEVES